LAGWPATPTKPPTAPFEFLAISASPEDQLTCTKQCLADQPSHPAVWRGEKYTHDRIRIGYFSADFRNHPVGRLAVGLLEAHDKSHFTTLALSSGPDDGSELRRRTKSAVDDFVDVRNRSDADVAALIRRREIDIVSFFAPSLFAPSLFAPSPQSIFADL
jgi:predicted O-linked N-acetylglucosamine transferase (SPINDLY family)